MIVVGDGDLQNAIDGGLYVQHRLLPLDELVLEEVVALVVLEGRHPHVPLRGRPGVRRVLRSSDGRRTTCQIARRNRV